MPELMPEPRSIAAARSNVESLTGIATTEKDIGYITDNNLKMGGLIPGTRERGKAALADWDFEFQKHLLVYDQEQKLLEGQMQAVQKELDSGKLTPEQQKDRKGQLETLAYVKDEQTRTFSHDAERYMNGNFNTDKSVIGTAYKPLTSVTNKLDAQKEQSDIMNKTRDYASGKKNYSEDKDALDAREKVLTAQLNDAKNSLEGMESSLYTKLQRGVGFIRREAIADKQQEVMQCQNELDQISKERRINDEALNRADKMQLSGATYQGSMVSGNDSPARTAEEQQGTLRSNLESSGMSPGDAQKYTVKESGEGKYTVMRDGKPALDVQDLGHGKGTITLHSSGDHKQDAKMLIAEIKAMKGNKSLDPLSISMTDADPKLVKALKEEAKAQGLNPDLITNKKTEKNNDTKLNAGGVADMTSSVAAIP